MAKGVGMKTLPNRDARAPWLPVGRVKNAECGRKNAPESKISFRHAQPTWRRRQAAVVRRRDSVPTARLRRVIRPASETIRLAV